MRSSPERVAFFKNVFNSCSECWGAIGLSVVLCFKGFQVTNNFTVVAPFESTTRLRGLCGRARGEGIRRYPTYKAGETRNPPLPPLTPPPAPPPSFLSLSSATHRVLLENGGVSEIESGNVFSGCCGSGCRGGSGLSRGRGKRSGSR